MPRFVRLVPSSSLSALFLRVFSGKLGALPWRPSASAFVAAPAAAAGRAGAVRLGRGPGPRPAREEPAQHEDEQPPPQLPLQDCLCPEGQGGSLRRPRGKGGRPQGTLFLSFHYCFKGPIRASHEAVSQDPEFLPRESVIRRKRRVFAPQHCGNSKVEGRRDVHEHYK